MPVRTIKSRGVSTVGWFPSIKLQRMVAYESTLERDYLYHLDYAHDVIFYEEQPMKITYEHEGQTRHYVPDFHVWRSTSPEQQELAECKPAVFVETDDNQRKFRAAQAWCAAQGWRFSIVTDTQLRAGWRLHNIKQLTLHARYKVDDLLCMRVLAALANQPAQPLGILARQIFSISPHQARQQILALAFGHKLHIDLDDAPLSDESLVYLHMPAHAVTHNAFSSEGVPS